MNGNTVIPAPLLIDKIMVRFSDLLAKVTYGETAIYYNPADRLPNGIYFCTVKEHDGPNDKASNLHRKNTYRFSFQITKEEYLNRFGNLPSRPSKGSIVDLGKSFDFSTKNKLNPHPIYGWMNWVQIINPTEESFEELIPLLKIAHQQSAIKFSSKVGD